MTHTEAVPVAAIIRFEVFYPVSAARREAAAINAAGYQRRQAGEEARAAAEIVNPVDRANKEGMAKFRRVVARRELAAARQWRNWRRDRQAAS